MALMRSSWVAACLVSVIFAACPASGQTSNTDAESIIDCISTKAGPEGDLPPAGPLREKFLKEMEGGPQACIGLVEATCKKSGINRDICIRREIQGWLAAVSSVPTGRPEKNNAIWRKTASGIRARAIALCEAAASQSAWGSETVSKKGRFGFGDDTICVRDGVAQQALILLVHVRGN